MEHLVDNSEKQSNKCRLIEDEVDPSIDEKPVTMEDAMEELGVAGRYQVIQISCACCSLVPFVFSLLNFVFIGYEPSHTCDLINETRLLDQYGLMNDSTASISYDSCSIGISSNSTGRDVNIASLGCFGGYKHAGGKYISMITEWDLVCDKRGVAELVQTIITLGMAVSSVFVASLADRVGRKYVFIASIAALLIAELGLVFTPSIYVAYGIRFLSGLSAGGMIFLHLVPCMELIISKYRQIFGAIDCILWSLSISLLAGMGYFLRGLDWRHFQLASALTCVPALICAFVMNETPAWYFAKGRYEDAQRILTKACKVNGKNVDKLLSLHRSNVRQAKIMNALDNSPQTAAIYSLLDIFRHRYIFIIAAIACMSWFANSLTYFGMFLTSSSLAGDRFLNFFLMAAIELPSALINMTLLIYLGRRTIVLSFMALSGICLLVSTVLVGLNSVSVHAVNASKAFFLLGKFAITCCFNATYTYTPEIFPTTIRSTGMALCATFSRVAGMLAAFLLPLFKIVPWAPGTILTSLCFLCVLLLPFLPETRGRELPTTIEEVLAWKKKKGKEKNKGRPTLDTLKSISVHNQII